MNHGSYLKLKNKVKNKNFFNSYKGLEKISYKASFFGNLFSILFAFFFMEEIIMKAVLNPTDSTTLWVGIISVAILVMFESIKRFVFDRFSMSFIKNRSRFNTSEVLILSMISAMFIAGSFYLSLNGAKNFASRDKEIVNMTKNDINDYKDSLTVHYNSLVVTNDSIYDAKTKVLEDNNAILFKDNRKYDTYIEDFTKKYNELSTDSWQERQEKSRIKGELKDQRKEKEKNVTMISNNDIKIETLIDKKEAKDLFLIKELETKIKEYETEKNITSSEKIDDNKGNSAKFLAFSTLIELIILFGIYFRHHYEYKSVTEYEGKIKNDPNYKRFHSWNTLLDVIMGNDEEIGTALPYKKDMVKVLSANKVDMTGKDFDDALVVFTRLGILKKKGNKKLINTDLETGREVLMKYLKIE